MASNIKGAIQEVYAEHPQSETPAQKFFDLLTHLVNDPNLLETLRQKLEKFKTNYLQHLYAVFPGLFSLNQLIPFIDVAQNERLFYDLNFQLKSEMHLGGEYFWASSFQMNNVQALDESNTFIFTCQDYSFYANWHTDLNSTHFSVSQATFYVLSKYLTRFRSLNFYVDTMLKNNMFCIQLTKTEGKDE